MPREKLTGQETATKDPYRGVPDNSEYFVLLDRNHGATAGFRRTYDPEYQDADPDDDVPSIFWEKGETVPAWAVTRSAWDGRRFAALDANLERVDTPGPSESTEEIDAPAVLREFRESHGVATTTVFECEGCSAQFDSREALSGHTCEWSSPGEKLEDADPDTPIRATEDESDETGEAEETDATEGDR